MNLMTDYKKEPDELVKLKEKNPKWINDDYVKFIRYSQHFIEKNREGILGFINNHSFIDNPTFRGMRWHLLKSFDEIYILDLHGNTKKKEETNDGSKDENVFDIQQGVSINLFIKTNKKKTNDLARVYSYDILGSRESKYEFLFANSIKTIPFEKLENIAPNYFFSKKDFRTQIIYEKGFKINELFPINSVGIVTARDNLTIHENKQKVIEVIEEFISLENETARSRFNLGKDARDWKIEFAKSDLSNSGPDFNKIVKISYRPFDDRFTYYTGKSRGFHCMPRGEVMQHFIKGENVGLVIGRQGQVVGSMPWNLIFITKHITDFNLYYRGGGMIFPLYALSATDSQLSWNQAFQKAPNFNFKIINNLSEKVRMKFVTERQVDSETFAPIDILDYIYGILHSPTYREKNKEFLKIDFPRIPYPKNKKIFWQLAKRGSELRQVHLLESALLDKFITTFPIGGYNEVSKIKIEDKKVWINSKQYFDGVPQIAWEFYIGGYQPAQKWLKDRKGKVLSFDDIMHYQKIIVALTETDRLMKEIDELNFIE